MAFAPLSLLVELAVDVKLPSDKDTLLPYLFNRFKVGKLFVGESRTLFSDPNYLPLNHLLHSNKSIIYLIE